MNPNPKICPRLSNSKSKAHIHCDNRIFEVFMFFVLFLRAIFGGEFMGHTCNKLSPFSHISTDKLKKGRNEIFEISIFFAKLRFGSENINISVRYTLMMMMMIMAIIGSCTVRNTYDLTKASSRQPSMPSLMPH